jgi:hypothetical protein
VLARVYSERLKWIEFALRSVTNWGITVWWRSSGGELDGSKPGAVE